MLSRERLARSMDLNNAGFTLRNIPSSGEVAAFDKFLGLKRKVSDVEKMANEPQKKRRKRMKTTFHSDDTRNDDSNYLSFPLHKETVQAVNVRRCRAYCAALGIKCTNGQERGLLVAKLENAAVPAGSTAGLARPTIPPGGGTWENWK